jgi:hypothetical protein
MLRKLRGKLTYANVMSTLAVFLVLAGGGTAVALSGSNTVFSDDVANDNFTSPTQGQGGLVASDLRAGSVGGSEIADRSVSTFDLLDGAGVAGSDVIDGSLEDQDVGQATLVNFALNIRTVDAGSCVGLGIAQVAQPGDHMLLTPAADSNIFFDYRVQFDPGFGDLTLIACNRSAVSRDDGTTHFSLLVFDAQ